VHFAKARLHEATVKGQRAQRTQNECQRDRQAVLLWQKRVSSQQHVTVRQTAGWSH